MKRSVAFVAAALLLFVLAASGNAAEKKSKTQDSQSLRQNSDITAVMYMTTW